jgi:hypothetical protein
MRTGLFILSILGLVAAAYSLSVEMSAQSTNNIIYLLLLIILLGNCGLGMVMTFPQVSGSKRKLRITPGKYAVRK